MVSAIELYSLTNADGATIALSQSQMVDPENTLEHARVYPNPLVDRFSLDLPQRYEGKMTLTMIDAAGRAAKIGDYDVLPGTAQMEVNLSHLKLSRGLYFLRVESEKGGAEMIKLMVK